MSTHLQEYTDLMKAARDPQDIITLAVAGVFSMRQFRQAPYDAPVFGLTSEDLRALVEQLFFGMENHPVWLKASTEINDRGDEFDDLVNLLLRHRTIHDDKSRWLAYIVATASMAENHLWQDLGLPSRAVLSQLLNTYFTSLAQRNTGDMKWKKFFYKQLCEDVGLRACRAPSCSVCNDYHNCFGPEEKMVNYALRP